MKTISILGATGCIGRKALDIASSNNFEILAITGHKNFKLILEQAKLYKPKYICVTNEKSYNIVKAELSSYPTQIFPGEELENIAAIDVDCCVMAISGNAGILSTFNAIGHAKRLAIATKEAIISGGKFLIELAKKKNTAILPIDSEHNAIFQCISGENLDDIKKIILTASGGPFLNLEENELNNITPLEALAHPNWTMGKKITIDSATLINKALEIIEAHYLFDIDIKKIEALIHPNSIIHGMVMFQDGSYKSVMSSPNMAMSISFALNYPHRPFCDMKEINFWEIGNLEFREPKGWQKRNIDLAYFAVNERKIIALNLTNEKYVYEFLSGKIKFPEIYEKTYETLLKSEPESINSTEDIKDILMKQKSDCQVR